MIANFTNGCATLINSDVSVIIAVVAVLITVTVIAIIIIIIIIIHSPTFWLFSH